MAFPAVQGTNTYAASSGLSDHTVNMPVGTVVSGDLLIVFVAATDNSAISIADGTWIQIFQTANGTSTNLAAFYKIATGDVNSVTVHVASASKIAAVSYWINAWHGTTPPEAGTAATGSSTTPDPPACTPSWGSSDILFIECAGHGADATFSGASTNYTNLVSAVATGGSAGSRAGCGTARRNVTGTTDNPDTMSISASQAWVANLVAVRPAASGTTFQITIAATGVGSLALVKIPTFPKTLAAVAVGVTTINKITSLFITLAATGVGLTTLNGKQFITSAATAVGVVTLTTASLASIGMDVTAFGLVTLTALAVVGLTLNATAVGIAVLTRAVTFVVNLSATAVGVTTMARKQFVTLTAVAVGVVSMVRKQFVVLAATGVGVVVLATATTWLRTMTATAVSVVGLVASFIPFSGGGGEPIKSAILFVKHHIRKLFKRSSS